MTEQGIFQMRVGGWVRPSCLLFKGGGRWSSIIFGFQGGRFPLTKCAVFTLFWQNVLTWGVSDPQNLLWIGQCVRIRVRIHVDPQHLASEVVRGDYGKWDCPPGETWNKNSEAPSYSRCVTIKTPPLYCSKALSAKHRPKVCKWWCFHIRTNLERDVKH
jgi:hypothetical protein